MSTVPRQNRGLTRRHSSVLPEEQGRRASATFESKATSFVQTLLRKKPKQAKDRSLPSPTNASSLASFSTDSGDEYEDAFTLSFSLSVLAERNDEFPQQVMVRSGSSGPAGGAVHQCLRENSVLNLHFVKDTSYVLTTNEDGDKYRVPLNSSLRFSPLHFASEPGSTSTETETYEKALEGCRFNSVGEILANPKLPMVVVVTEKASGCPFDPWEILVIKRAKQRRQDRGRYLVIHSFLTGREVCLDDGAELKCSTKPDHFQLYLPEIVNHMQLPVKVMINEDKANVAYSLLEGKLFTLHPGGVMKSIIATCPDEPHHVLEIQADTNLDITLLHPNAPEANDLVKRSLEMHEEFSSVGVEEYILGEEYEVDLFSQVYDPEVGIKLYKPQQLASGHSHTEANPESVSKASPMPYEIIRKSNSEEQDGAPAVSKSGPMPYETIRKSSSEDQDAACDGGSLYDTVHMLSSPVSSVSNQAKCEGKYDNIQKLQHDVEEVKTGFHSLQDELINISDRLTKMEVKLHTLQQTMYNGKADRQYANIPCDLNPDVSTTNTEHLLALNNSQVLKLLEQLNLATYKEAFKREQIDGWLFGELSNDILEQDLGIESRLHRLKIMRVVEGKLKVNWSFCAK